MVLYNFHLNVEVKTIDALIATYFVNRVKVVTCHIFSPGKTTACPLALLFQLCSDVYLIVTCYTSPSTGSGTDLSHLLQLNRTQAAYVCQIRCAFWDVEVSKFSILSSCKVCNAKAEICQQIK